MSELVIWVDAAGAETALNGVANRDVMWGRQGAFMPTWQLVEERVPLQPGARLRSVTAAARELALPVVLREASETALRTAVRAFLRTFNPLRGDGRLRVTAPDASERELVCRYIRGLEGNEQIDVHGLVWVKLVLVFRASDPYWYARNTVVDSYTAAASTGLFFPLPPLRLSSASVFADATVDNPGDVEAWPVWTVTGPGSGLVLRNLSTGESLSLSTALGSGESVAIDTRPGVKTVTKSDGTNLFGDLSATSALWALQSGTNSLRVELSGVTSASGVVLSYTPRYLGA